ncbi:MAG: hypothetical protein DIU58_007905 [Sphaerobacter thermophilus]|uniref:hypothetical protein n=1 Tax=Sphaerobacter thermophilus TaxID=2057 RepID=UPI002354E27E
MHSNPWVNLKLAASRWQERHDAAEHWRTVRDLDPPPTRRTLLASLATSARNILRIGRATAASQVRGRVARQHRELDLN